MKKRSLLWRVTTLAVAVAGIASGSVALFSSLLSDRLILRAEDQWLRETAAALMTELPRTEANGWLREEVTEFAPAGVEIALFRDGAAVLATPLTRPRTTLGCATDGAWRTCWTTQGENTLLAAKSLAKATAHRPSLALASVVAILLTMTGAALLSRRAAKWAVRFDEELEQTRRFASNAAHEMRTPLTTLNAEIELLRESPSLGEAEAGALSRVHTTIARLKGLIERLLILATTPARSAVFHENVSMSELCDSLLAGLPPGERSRVTARCDNDLLTVRGDAALLSMLLNNGVENALKFSGSEPVSVTVDEDALHVRLVIRDRGPGIAPDEHERAFEAFYRSPNARASQVGGHGIGLALISHISKLHGGDAKFLVVAQGAALEITLPKPQV